MWSSRSWINFSVSTRIVVHNFQFYFPSNLRWQRNFVEIMAPYDLGKFHSATAGGNFLPGFLMICYKMMSSRLTEMSSICGLPKPNDSNKTIRNNYYASVFSCISGCLIYTLTLLCIFPTESFSMSKSALHYRENVVTLLRFVIGMKFWIGLGSSG